MEEDDLEELRGGEHLGLGLLLHFCVCFDLVVVGLKKSRGAG